MSAREILAIPEIAALDAPRGVVRVPPEIDVPLTPRVRRLIDTAEFRRLASIRQLGLVALVYPGATHSRFEHSLGVYRLALVFARRLASDARFAAVVTAADVERFLVAALLHDVGHWPYCHPLEDLKLAELPTHEARAAEYLESAALARALRDDWQLQPDDVRRLLEGEPGSQADRVLRSLLSGPIDIDKTDYLARDSLHAGVPYGRHFDQGRLISSLVLNAESSGLAISEKGRTAAELLMFARYVMFSEVYWHHAVRSATAMLQRAFFELLPTLDISALLRQTDEPFLDALRTAAQGTGVAPLIEGLFGRERRLYKRAAEYSFFQSQELYPRLARRGYPWLVACGGQLAEELSARLGRSVAATDVLIDAPPVKRETAFDVEVWFAKDDRYRRLADISPLVASFARLDFDDYVKRVRVFTAPEIAPAVAGLRDLDELMVRAIERNEAE